VQGLKSYRGKKGVILLPALLVAAALNGLMLVGRFYGHEAPHFFSGLLAKLPLRQLLDELYEAGLGGLERSSTLRW
jgi:hypothetical protein